MVLATHNGAAWLGDALRSIAAQTEPPGEVVVAIGGSTDDTEAVLADVAADHPDLPLVVVALATNHGASENRNRGIEAASGPWIAICDDDDAWRPDKLRRQLDLIRGWTASRPLAVVCTWGTNVNERLVPVSDAPMGVTSIEEHDAVVAHGGLFYCLHSSLLLRRLDVDAVGGYSDEYGPGLEDVVLLSRLAERGVIQAVPEPLVLYRKRAGSMQLSFFRGQQEGLAHFAGDRQRALQGLPPLGRDEWLALRAADPAWRRLRRRLRLEGLRHYRIGAVAAANGHRFAGGLHLGAAVVLDPSRVISGVRSAVATRRAR